MPRRFDKAARDEWLALGKSSTTCKACCAGNCKDCQGTCDCPKCHEPKGASTLDALESKVADVEDDQDEGADNEGQCPACGGPSKLLGALGKRQHYRCEDCGMEHSSTRESKTADVLAEPAMHNPDLLVPPSSKPASTVPCTHCGAPLAPFVLEHRLNCPHCGNKQQPIRWEGVMGSHTAAPIFPEQAYMPSPAQEHVHPNDRQAPGWAHIQSCPQCGHGMTSFEGQRGAVCPNCGHEEAIMSVRSADVSMPPQGPPMEAKETALPYNPGAYEDMVEGMHPAAQFTYQRAVQQGAPPQAAMAAAQEKQGEMMKRTQEGQNVEGIQIPVISNSNAAADETDSSTALDRAGFVATATIQRVAHLVFAANDSCPECGHELSFSGHCSNESCPSVKRAQKAADERDDEQDN